MLYATRNAEGRIVGLSDAPSANAEPVDIQNPEVLQFLSVKEENFVPDAYLDESDIGIARILEDLIELLVRKNQILFTELPTAAQKKLLSRRIARQLINGEEYLEPAEGQHAASSFLIEEDKLL